MKENQKDNLLERFKNELPKVINLKEIRGGSDQVTENQLCTYDECAQESDDMVSVWIDTNQK